MEGAVPLEGEPRGYLVTSIWGREGPPPWLALNGAGAHLLFLMVLKRSGGGHQCW